MPPFGFEKRLISIPLFAAWLAASSDGQTPASAREADEPGDATLDSGEAVAKFYCSTCHVFPEPSLLDKKTWLEQTLPRMKIRMGLAPEQLERNPEAKLLKATGVFPEKPMLSPERFFAIVKYYLTNAPEEPLPQNPRDKIDVGIPLFRYEKPEFIRPPAATTMVHISPKEQRIFTGDAEAKTLDIYDGSGRHLDALAVANVPVDLKEMQQGIYLTMIGSFMPSENPIGAFAFLPKDGPRFGPPKILLDKLPRPTYTAFADLNGDGKLDFVMCMFGNNVGRVSWFENLGHDQYREHVLIPKAGALRCEVRDLNGDGIPDLAVLVTQETESLYFLINDGKGNFQGDVIFRQHPLFGHTYFELDDFNHDGLMDVLVTNGDNGEYPSPTKCFHGIRIFMNRGKGRFEQSFFYPLNGAFKAVARDFDEDGDLDIAAISFFPDYQKSPEESFVYLENLGNGTFHAATFRECISGRWLTMDVGDIDGDGDLDIVLGSYIHGPSDVPDFLMQTWDQIGPSMVILRNQLRTPWDHGAAKKSRP